MNQHTSKHDNHTQHAHHQEHAQEHNHGHDHHAHMVSDFRRRFWASLVLTLPILVLSPMLQSWVGVSWQWAPAAYVQLALATALFFYGGLPFLKGMKQELGRRQPAMMTLVALAISVAYFYSTAVALQLVEGKPFFWELASLIDIMLLGHWFEMKSVMGASRALEALSQLLPATARRRKPDGSFEEVKVEHLQAGDEVVIRPGERIPADGEVIEGESYVNESMLTGESVPVAKKAGDRVAAGSVNDHAVLVVRVTHVGNDTYLNKVIAMVQEAQKSKSKTQNLADKAAAWLFYIALGVGVLTFFAWWSSGSPLDFALERAVTVMIIACPHALGLAVPLVVAISTTLSAQNGLLIRNRTAFENARKISAMVFDKTGTLTKGNFGVRRYDSLHPGYTKEQVLQLAASLEQHSEHPIAHGIVKKAEEEGLAFLAVSAVENITGKGIRGEYEGKELLITNAAFFKEQYGELPAGVEGDGTETVVLLLHGGDPVGFLALADALREESKPAVEQLHRMHIKVFMATGDSHRVAEAVSKKLGLDGFYAEVLPDEKQRIVKELQQQGEFVAMTGDGVNDAPALAQADVGIAVGSGTDVAAETADIILVNSNPQDIVHLIVFGRATYRKMRQNLWWATGYNLFALPLAAGVLAPWGIMLSPAIGGVLMSVSTIIVALNAQLLKKQVKLHQS
ncbi:MAG: copper-translocating P-type ATPase [Thermonema sp.]|uniref:copper-translocating P-type ATPase n=1 Tax=Thermonema sp. TaxID=2231181 RepID=UPI0021DBD2E2|nr:copper-translocating P-type ATPase [Thermonema sp.]GIV39213.1 MAG: copper-translocating P-type ATPase [Thermonema sp.]